MTFMTKTLELDTILAKVESYAKSQTTHEIIGALKPMISLDEIHQALDETRDMMSLIQRQGLLPFIEDYDIEPLFDYALLGRMLSIREILTIQLFLKMEKDILHYFKEAKRNKVALGVIETDASRLMDHHDLLSFISSKLDEDGLVLDDATPELYHIRRQLLRLEKSVQDKIQKLLVDYALYVNEPVIVIRNGRLCIPIKDGYKNKIKGIIHDMSSSGQTVYIEPEATRQLTAEIETLKIKEENEIQRILSMISQEVSQNGKTLKSNMTTFIHLDLNAAKARYAWSIDAHKPLINEEGKIHLIKARHPLIDPSLVVPIEVELDDSVKTLLITGPNTGGKTVALKTVGLLTLMVQTGLLIPASDHSSVSIFHQVFADIGDEQSIQQSLSTFSSHLTKIIQMIHHVKDRTLILLDELGSGTDPNEGVSLAMAILDYFRQFDIRMMVTTHYSELKMYAYETPHMRTASVAFDKKSLKPLYYLQMGTTGSSHAFLIARRLGLKDDVVRHAEHYYEGRQSDLAKIMEMLTDEMAVVTEKKKQLQEDIEKTERERRTLIEKKEVLEKAQESVIEAIRKRETDKWEALKDDLRTLILSLQSKSALTNPELAELKRKLNQGVADDHSHRVPDELAVEDQVFIIPYQQMGTITSIEKDKIRVVFGPYDMVFDRLELKKESKPIESKTKPKASRGSTGSTPERKASFELDLRGYRFEEVKEAMDQAIDSAMLSGLTQIRVIHGFGTGAVRKAVYDYIKSSKYIQSSRFGGEGEGLNGVTILTLK